MALPSRLEALNDRSLLRVVEGVLTPEQCAMHIERIENERMLRTLDRTAREVVRHNARAIVVDPSLAALIYTPISPHLPSPLVGMEPCGANECIRYYRYEPGDFFKPHQDTHFVRNAGERSLFSIVVYLNDDYEGGEIVFHDIDRVVRPAPGLAVVFGHRMTHESKPITRGVKYAFRSDVMYRG